MEEDKNIKAAAALAAIVALVMLVIQFAGRPARVPSAGPGWFSRVSPFGSAPIAEPAPAAPRAAPELAAPERMMTNAATRLFSSPTSAGSSGGLAGAESPPAEAGAAMNAARLQNAGVDLPQGSRAPIAGGSASLASSPGSGAPTTGTGGGAAPRSAAGAGPGTGAASSARGGKAPVGDVKTAAGGAASFDSAARASSTSGGTARLAGASAPGAGAPPAGEALKDPAELASASPGAAGGGGGGPGAGGLGGGGGGAGGGLGGGLPGGAKPKQSAGKPEGVSLNEPGGGGGGGGPGGGAGAGEVQAQAPVIGVPEVGTVTARGGMFRLKPDGPAEVPTTIHVMPGGAKLVGFTAKLAIDADGAGDAWKGDRTGRPQTALLYKSGESLNPRTVPFIVVPLDFHVTHPDVRLGDYASVTYGAKTLYAIVGDKGPAGVLGEGSIALAAGLGIDTDPNRGGVSRKDVRYLIAPGTRDAEPPRDGAAIQARGRVLFQTAGVRLQ